MPYLTRRSAIYPALLLLFASFPIISETTEYYLVYSVICLLLFPLYAFISTRNIKHSLLAELYRAHPILFFTLMAFAFSSLFSLATVLFGKATIEQKVLALLRYTSCVLLAVYTFAMARFMLRHNRLAAQLFSAIGFGVVLLITALLLVYVFHADSQYYAQYWWVNPPVGMHIRIMGMMASVGVAASLIYIVLSAKQTKFVILCWTLLFFNWAMVIWTGGRISILACTLFVLLTLILSKVWLKLSMQKVCLLAITLLAATVLAELLSIMPLNGLFRTLQGFSALGEENLLALSEELGSGRWQQWQAALTAVSQSPWFGLGPFGYYFIDRPTSAFHTHNFVVESLVEWGVVGTVLLMFSLLYMAWHGLKKIKPAVMQKDVNYLIAVSVIFVLTITSMADGVYFLLLPAYIALTGFACFPFFTESYKKRLLSETN